MWSRETRGDLAKGWMLLEMRRKWKPGDMNLDEPFTGMLKPSRRSPSGGVMRDTVSSVLKS